MSNAASLENPCLEKSSLENHCLTCGACCATFRVSFYWSEAEALGLANNLVEQISPWHSCMAGTNQQPPRCQALQGRIGDNVTCSIYQQRPSPCHELQPGDDKCNRARALHGLPPIVGAYSQVASELLEGNSLISVQPEVMALPVESLGYGGELQPDVF